MPVRSTIGLFSLALCGCLTSSFTYAPRATINDLVGNVPLASTCQIVSVDGKPARRLEGVLIDYVPEVVVAPGVHTLTVAQKFRDRPRTATVSASFEAGKQYKFKIENETISVIEDVHP